MTVMKKLKLKLQGLQKKKDAVADDEVGLLGYVHCFLSETFVAN